MDKEIASIMFMPVCTKCLKIIRKRIDAWQSVDMVCGSPKIVNAAYDISPDECPYCGALFNNITMPTKLPFNPCDYM